MDDLGDTLRFQETSMWMLYRKITHQLQRMQCLKDLTVTKIAAISLSH